jgi:peptide chain release factor 3
MLADFEKSSAGANLSHDAAGNLAYLASSGVNLKLTQERWPGVTFHSTREHAVKIV